MISMSAVLERFFPEIDTRKAIACDRVVHKDIVRILVAYGDAILAVVFDLVVFKSAVTHPPAEKEAHLAVIVDATALYSGSWAARSWMNAVARVTKGLAVEHLNVIGDLERDTIAIVVAGYAIADGRVLRAIKVDRSTAAAIDVGILCLVPIDGKILKDNTICFNGTQNWKRVANHGSLSLSVVVPQRHRINAQQVALNRTDCTNRDVPATVEKFVGNGDSHSATELLRLGNSKLILTIVAILSKQTLNACTLSQDRLTCLPANGNA